MAGRILGYTTTTEVQGEKVVKVKEFHALSEPSEVYFEFREPAFVTVGDAQYRADELSGIIETILANGAVTDVLYSQDVTPGGRLLDIFTTYWQTPDGSREGYVTTRMSAFTPGVVLGQVSNDIDAGG